MAAMMLSISIVPAMAKPLVVTVVLQYPDRTPYVGVFCLINVNRNQYYYPTTDSHGKANVEIGSNWLAGDLIEVRYSTSAPLLGSGYLNNKQNLRIVIKDLI